MAKSNRSASSTHQVTPAGTHISRSGSTLRVSAGGVDQSTVNLARPAVIEFEYLQHMDLLLDATMPLWEAAHPRVFHAGAGACALALAWESKHAGLSQVAAEVDAELAETVRVEANLRRKPRLRLKVGDAKELLTGSQARYHLIIRDAFIGPDTPRHLRTVSWMSLIRTRLQQEGAYFANVGKDRSHAAKQDVAAVVQTFPQVVVVTDPKVWRGDRNGNLVVAAWSGLRPDIDEVDRQLRRLPLPARLYRTDEVHRWLGGATAPER